MKSVIAVFVFFMFSAGYAEENSISSEKMENFRQMLFPGETKEESLIKGIEFIQKQIDKTDENETKMRMYLFQRKELVEIELDIHRHEKILKELKKRKSTLEQSVKEYHENIEE